MQPWDETGSLPMQRQAVTRTYASAEAFARDAARMTAHGFTARHDVSGVTWERWIPSGGAPPIPRQARERNVRLWLAIGAFAALVLVLLILIVATNAGTAYESDSQAPLDATATPNRAVTASAARARTPTATQASGVVPRVIALPSSPPEVATAASSATPTPTTTAFARPTVRPLP